MGEEEYRLNLGEEEQAEYQESGEPILAPTTDYLRELTKLPVYFPDRMKTLYWAYYGKDVMLSKLYPADIIALKNRVGLIVAIAHITQPDYEYTNEQLLDYTNLKHHVLNQAHRAVAGFERIMETQQTRMAITRAEAGTPSLVSPRRQGLLRRIFGGGKQ